MIHPKGALDTAGMEKDLKAQEGSEKTSESSKPKDNAFVRLMATGRRPHSEETGGGVTGGAEEGLWGLPGVVSGVGRLQDAHLPGQST